MGTQAPKLIMDHVRGINWIPVLITPPNNIDPARPK